MCIRHPMRQKQSVGGIEENISGQDIQRKAHEPGRAQFRTFYGGFVGLSRRLYSEPPQ